MKSVVVVGSINMDMVYRVDRIPLAGETVLSRSMERYAGGKGANQAVAASRMGAKTRIIGCVGKDEAGDWMLDSLRECGVLLDAIDRTAEAPTGTALITVSNDGENCIVVSPGANGMIDAAHLAHHEQVLREAGYCVFQLEIPIETVFWGIRRCHELGVKVVLNPSPCAAIPADVLKCVSLLIVNRSEYASLAGEGADPVDFVRAKGIDEMIVSLGSNGLDHVTAHRTRHYSCERVEAVDTTGAGDCLLGALVALLAEGRPMEEAITYAMKAAAIAVTRPGAQRSMPHRREVDGLESVCASTSLANHDGDDAE